jgi:hypothetical protein
MNLERAGLISRSILALRTELHELIDAAQTIH